MMLFDIGMHLTQCNSGQNVTIQFAYKYGLLVTKISPSLYRVLCHSDFATQFW